MPRSVPMVQINTDLANLPPGIMAHIKLRTEERKINPSDTVAFRHWCTSRPRVQQGEDWYKDFGSFILVGHDVNPKSVLSAGMRPYGRKLASESQGRGISMFKTALLKSAAPGTYDYESNHDADEARYQTSKPIPTPPVKVGDVYSDQDRKGLTTYYKAIGFWHRGEVICERINKGGQRIDDNLTIYTPSELHEEFVKVKA
jgi:hypothetical protein